MKKLVTISFLIIIICTNIKAQKNMNTFINPFTIDIDPMESLLLVNFENDPDSIYVGFEPQIFNDDVNGKGHLIIGWRKDGKVDVFHQKGLKLKAEKYDIAGKGLHKMTLTEMKYAICEFGECGINCYYEFQDNNNRKIKIIIREHSKKKIKPFGLLAPMGMAAESPSALPLVYVNDFYFVRKKHTEIKIQIDKKVHKADMLPIPMNFQKMYFSRYSTNPVIATLNAEYKGVINKLEVESGVNIYEDDKYIINLNNDNGRISIKEIVRKNEKQDIKLSFSPAFPNLENFDLKEFKGEFEIFAHKSTGKIKGNYKISKIEEIIIIEMIPSKGWSPNPDRLSLRFLYTVGKIFKNWPKTYKWTAIIEESKNDFPMKSNWERILDN